MRIAVVAQHVLRYGGMERAAAEVVRRFARHHDVTVLAASCEVAAERLTWVPLKNGRGPAVARAWAFDRAVRARRWRMADRVVNSVGVIGADVHVLTAHFCLRAFRERCRAVRGAGTPLLGTYHRWVERVAADRERSAYRSPTLRAVIAVSHGLKRELLEYHGLPNDRVIVIPNGVDHTVFRPAADGEAKQRLRRDLGLPETAFLGLFVGGDWERKGLAGAIQAVAGLADAVLVVVGRGNTPRFRALAHRLGAAVIFAGLSKEPERYFAAADAYVFPSRYEAFPLSPLEAAASGLPVIAPPLNGIEEWLRDGVNGYVVEPTAEAIRARLVNLRDDRERHRRMSAAAVHLSQRFDWDDVAARQLAVLRSVAAATGA